MSRKLWSPERHFIRPHPGTLPPAVESSIMLFHHVLSLTVLASSSVLAIHLDLKDRAGTPACAIQCNAIQMIYQRYLNKTCDASCICKPSTIDDVSICYTCLTNAGVDPSPLSPETIPRIVRYCAANGHPIGGTHAVFNALEIPTNLPLTDGLPSISGIPSITAPPSIIGFPSITAPLSVPSVIAPPPIPSIIAPPSIGFPLMTALPSISGFPSIPSISPGFPPISAPSNPVAKNTGVAIAPRRLGVLITVTALFGLMV